MKILVTALMSLTILTMMAGCADNTTQIEPETQIEMVAETERTVESTEDTETSFRNIHSAAAERTLQVTPSTQAETSKAAMAVGSPDL